MDSLIGVEVQQTLERRYDVTLSMAEIRKLTVNRLVAIQEGTGNTTSEAGNAARTGRRNAADPAFESKMPRLKLAEKLFPDRVLVEMNDLDGSTPLFMVHPVQGDVSVLFEIAAHIPVRTVGVQRTDEIPVRSIEEMAAIYLQRMLQVQPAGPYHLAGYSYGAAVVFEAAVQLQASGASVGSLTLLDGGPRYVAALWSHHKSRLEGSEHDAETSLICTFLMQYADIDVLEVRHQLNQCPSWDAKTEVATDILFGTIPDVHLSRRDVATAMRAFYDLLSVGSNYQPNTKFCGDVVLIKASRPREMAKQLPPDYGLSEFVHGTVEVNVVDGSHEQFILGQGARQCAAIIARQVLHCKAIALRQ
ncbi:hypothetical protein V5799_026634 [Amblyomma americanum]|uniref:oleoyl-[acyl-carrier-protein] hydrolase n=1 Tax=Amblyomma americanum TaxID=6943 RepID=A0AAQ4DI08_AMBAM